MKIQHQLIFLSTAVVLLLASCGNPADPSFPDEERPPRDSTETVDFRAPGN